MTRRCRAALAGPGSLVGLLSVVGGCAVGPDFTRADEAPVPQVWRAASDPQVSTAPPVEDAWWKTFADPTLDQLVEMATSQNLSLQAAGLRIAEARAQREVAQGRLFPQVQVAVGSFTANGFPQQVADYTGFGRNALSYETYFDAAWELDVWGRYRRGVEAETANTRATVADQESVFVSLTAEVARAYVTIRTYEALIAQARESVRIQEESMGIALSRFRNGAASELDPAQASALLESTRATIPPLDFEVQAARNALSTLLGQPVGAVDRLLQDPVGIPRVPASVAVGVPVDLVRRRPDVRRAEQLAAAQSARVGVAAAELYPKLVLVGTVGLRAWDSGQASHNLFSEDAFHYMVGPRIVWPLFNYGRLTNDVRVQDARLQQLLVDYRDTVLRAVQEVEDALVRFRNARDALALQEHSLKAAERAVELSLVQYREGAVDFQRVLDSQRSLLEQQVSVVRSTSSVATGVIALYKALGGGWGTLEDRPIVPVPIQKEMNERTDWSDLVSRPRER